MVVFGQAAVVALQDDVGWLHAVDVTVYTVGPPLLRPVTGSRSGVATQVTVTTRPNMVLAAGEKELGDGGH